MSVTLAPILIAAAWIAVSLLRRHGGMLAPRAARRVGLGALAAAGLLLLARQVPLALALAMVGAGLLLPRAGASRRPAGAARGTGAPSRVETAALAMELDPSDGAMDGDVRTGTFAGRRLSSLDRDALLRLAAEIDADDEASLRLLSGYLDWRFPDWREAAQGWGAGTGDAQSGGAEAEPMPRREALRVLGLPDDAEPDAIRDAYRRLMKKVHPDQGGSAELAARVQAARDALLG